MSQSPPPVEIVDNHDGRAHDEVGHDDPRLSDDGPRPSTRALLESWGTAGRILRPLASLKLTIVLLGMSIFIILAGTFAQVDKDIWEVVDDYFRINFATASHTGNWFSAFFARIDFDIFFPPAFFRGDFHVPGYVFFPKGWLIGLIMSLNLLAAHLIRFKIQARGARLWWGLGVLILGILGTFVVVETGSNAHGVQQSVFATNWKMFWQILLVGIAIAFLAALYGAVMIDSLPTKNRVGFGILAVSIGALLAWLLWQGPDGRLGDPSLRILWQLIKATLAGSVLLVGCILLFNKRAGVVLLHGGIGLMMFSELLVGTTAKEAQMQFMQGETRNFIYDIRSIELAVIEPTGTEDKVHIISEQVLQDHLPQAADAGKVQNVLSNPALPFDLRIVEYYRSSVVDLARVDDPLVATSGVGTIYVLLPVRQANGVSSDSADLPGAYVECLDKTSGKSLGTYLLWSGWLDGRRQAVMHEGKQYDLSLRFAREYLPYSVTLSKASREDYIGTDNPRDYSSDVVIKDPELKSSVSHHIWMNNPLRYRNRTFYQSGFSQDPSSGKPVSTLQVVSNAGWLLPYVACMIVAVGMLGHFFVILVRYLGRRRRERQAEFAAEDALLASARARREDSDGGIGAKIARWFPLGVVSLCGIWLLSLLPGPSLPKDGMDLAAFGKLPVVYEGRVKPFDTLARTSLRRISAKQTFYDKNDARQPAMRWLLDLMSGRPEANAHRVIRMDNPDVVKLLGLDWRSTHAYSVNEFLDAIKNNPAYEQAIESLRTTPAAKLTAEQQKLGEVRQALNHIQLLIQSFRSEINSAELVAARQNGTLDQLASSEFQSITRRQQSLNNDHAPFALPFDLASGDWRPYSPSADLLTLTEAMPQELQMTPEQIAGRMAETVKFRKILEAYRGERAAEFNDAVKDYRSFLEEKAKAAAAPEKSTSASVEYDQTKHDFEAFFNRVEPFYYASVLYVLAGLFGLFAWLGWSEPLNRTSFWLLCLTFVIHTLALMARMYISGRPPVTNLYSTGIFISWGCVLISLILERWSKLGLGNVIAAACGFGGLLVAHLLTTSVINFRGDTFTVMQAVLDTQFWLATHVVIINLGYAATALAGAFGALYIFLGIATPKLSRRADQHLTRMTYGTLCFAIFFSFIGTVLGGLWADDSWGRFWGWDPKENGALIIVLWNAIVLHARWDNLIKDRGLAVLAVLGNICVTWSWFMVNELGVGLHSYGFTEGVLAACAVFIASQLVIAGAGMFVSKHLWWSIRARSSA